MKTIDIIFLTRDRSWILPQFLQCILDLDYPKEYISIKTIINDSIDDSDRILYKFQKEHKDEYKDINITTYNLGTPVYNGSEGERGKIEYTLTKMKNTTYTVYKNLAKLRNSLLLKVKSDYAFNIDTDILFKPDTLNKLLEHNKDYVSALICNGHMIAKKDNKINPYCYCNIMNKTEGGYKHIIDYDDKGLLPVDLTGAIMLLSNRLCKSNAKFGFSVFGEDALFCESAQSLGFELFCDTDVRCSHIMNKDLLESYNKGEYTF